MKHLRRFLLLEFLSAFRHAMIAAFLIFSFSVVQGCNGRDDTATGSSSSASSSSSSSSAASSHGTPEPTDLSHMHGRVLNVAGRSIEGADIAVYRDGTATKISVVSRADGTFSLELEAAQSFVLRVGADGFADQVLPVESANVNGRIFIDTTLIARAESINVSTSGTLMHTGVDGAAVSVDKADFVDLSGVPVTEDIQLTITPVDVSNPAIVAAFPGRFDGVPEGELKATPIVSLGVVEYEFSVDGQPVNLAAGSSAEIVVPIYVTTYPDGSPVEVEDTIPLWSLNENTGLWTQEGVGTVVVSNASPTGLAFRATVTHFSWWNCDVAPQTAQVQITVLGEGTGDAVIFANAPELVNWRGENASTTINIGETTTPLYIPAGLEVCFTAIVTNHNGSSATTDGVCLTANPGELVDVILLAGEEGPLDITSKPSDEEEDTVTISALTDTAIPPVALFPLTSETVVNYVVTAGQLPQGLSLDTFGSQARIVGVPTEAGHFSVTITATDSDGFTDEVVLNYAITAFNPLTQLLLPFDQQKCNSSNTSSVAYLELSFPSGDGKIDWGDDGPIETFQAVDSPIVLSHEYSSQSVGTPVLTLSDGIRYLTRLQIGRDRPRTDSCFSFDISNLSGARSLEALYVYPPMKTVGTLESLPRSLATLFLGRGNSVKGDLKELPRSLIELNLYQTGALLTGEVRDLPRSLTHLYLGDFNNVVGGDIKDLPPSLIDLTLYGRYTVSGDVKDLPQMLTKLTFGLEMSDSASGPRGGAVTGDVANLPRSLTDILLLSVNNTVTGDVENLPPLLNSLHLGGENKVSGDVKGLPRSLTFLDLQGKNQVLGDINGLPGSLTHLNLRGDNEVTGDIADLPESLSTVILYGSNSVYGDLGQLKINDAINIDFRGDNQISDFGLNPSWNPNPNPPTPQGGFGLYLGGNSALDASEVDRLLQYLSDKLPTRYWTPAPTIGIVGSSSPRTAASDIAVSTLEDKLYRVLTNE